MTSPVAPASTPPVARADRILIGAVLLVAGAAASVTARNSDLWLHLATGRALASGEYSFGIDPFGYTTAGRYWANHAWLSDLLMYLGHRTVGGGGLVALKSLAVVATAGFMLATARRIGTVWVGGLGVTVAILAMSPGVTLQPVVVSLLLLAVVMYLLNRGGRAAAWVPVLIAAWVNLDAWYILGPLAVVLFVAGRRLAREPAAPRIPRWVLPASFAACLVNPHHVRGLTLPMELSPAVWTSAFADDPRMAGLFASPWRFGTDSLAAWAFIVLLALGLMSFAVNRRAILGWPGLVWLAFAGLAAWQSRLVPFFAVVAGPITALNLGEALPGNYRVRSGRALAGGLTLVLLALAWPGWLQGFSNRDRGLAWAVHVDPSLERAAGTAAAWRADGTLAANESTFASDPDTAHYLVWANPGERVFMDSRLELFVHVAEEYAGICRAFDLIPPKSGSPTGESDLRSRGVSLVLVHDRDPRRAARGLRAALTAPSHPWIPVRVDGSVVLLGRSGEATRRFEPPRLAFGPATDEWPAAPVAGPDLAGRPADIWANRYVPRRTAWQSDGAATALTMFQLMSGPTAGEKSPALPLLAVRGARSAVAASPADDEAWAALGRAYATLHRGSWESRAGEGFPILAELRHVQTAAALHQAVIRNPDSVPGHEGLAGLFAERGFVDLSHYHRQNQVRLAKRAGALPGEKPEAFTDRLARLNESLNAGEAAVQDAENRFLVQTDRLAGDPLARARIALRLGLADRAIDTLVSSHADLYGAEGLRLLLDLLLATGRAAEARELLARPEIEKNPDGLGVHQLNGGMKDGQTWGYAFVAYHWFDFCQSAASGHYTTASAAAARLKDRAAREEAGFGPAMFRGLALQVASETGFGVTPATTVIRAATARERVRLTGLFAQVRFLAAVRADLEVLEGLLWLEQGSTGRAAVLFEHAGAEYAAAGHIAPARPGMSVAGRYSQTVRPAR
jgi:hypothetical protein